MIIKLEQEEEIMPDDPKAAPRIVIGDRNNVPFVFVSDIASAGHGNGVVNLTFITANFTPRGSDKDDIDPDLQITARLRMDMYCVERLYEQLDTIIRAHKVQPGGKPN